MLEKAICFKFDLERMKMKIYIIGGSGSGKTSKDFSISGS